MSETLDYLAAYARFPLAVRRLRARPPLTVAEAGRVLRERMARRADNFLLLVERGVYARPRSPYLALLRHAGCELGDLRHLVQAEGVEGALERLHAAGVWIAFEEFKGRKPIRRGSLALTVQGRDFDNPLARREMWNTTGGSTGAAHSVALDLDNLADRAAQRLAALDAHGLAGAPTAVWQGVLPSPGLRKLLFGLIMGNPPERWFSPVGLRAARRWMRYGAATYYTVLCMRLAGLRAPFPEYVGVEQAEVVARWAADAARRAGRCVVHAGVSRGARLGLAAQAAGLDLTGAAVLGAGEPPTPAKVAHITRAGARYVTGYGMTDAGQVGSGCACPADESDVHVHLDSLALIGRPRRVEGFDLTVPAFVLTTLLPTSPKLLLNVEMDDCGILEERACGCALEGYGFTLHARQIRSYTKFTGEGVTLLAAEMQRVIEEGLPQTFGGTPLDYQLLEEEDAQGLTRLYLLVHPRLPLADEQAVVDFVLAALGRSSSMADAARAIWQGAGSLRVRRAEPIWTARGKLLPLHSARAGPNSRRRSKQEEPL